MKKMNITENLLRNMTTQEERRVAMYQGFSSNFEVGEVNPLMSSTYDVAIMMKFSVSWECHQIVKCGDGDAELAKVGMVRHIKNDMYRDILNELYGIQKLVATQQYHNRELSDRVQALIEELR